MALHLNIGAGSVPLPDHIEVDRKSGGEAYPLKIGHQEGIEFQLDGLAKFVREDNGKAHWVPNDGIFDSIYSSHILEHFSHRNTLEVLKEWVRVLKPGGTIKIAVPNFDYVIAAYNSEHGGQLPLESYLFGGHSDDDDHHGAMFNDGKLRALMRMAGLSGIRPWKSEVTDCASLHVSLNLMGTKRAPVEKLEGVSGVISMPRLAFTDQATAVYETCHKLRIPMRVRQGVYWEATLTRAIEETFAAENPEYILTLDYDTVFTPNDVAELYVLMRDNPHADAICATQVGRDRDSVLLTIRDEDGKNRSTLEADKVYTEELLPVSTAHFGLTMIRASSLKNLPKPWFCSKPDSDGRWGEGRVDADIAFWRAAEAANWKVYQANTVNVGHLQLMVSWAGRDLTPIHQYVADYRTNGKPDGVLA